VVTYFFFCYCCAQICRKTNNRPGFLVWLPVLKWFPLFRAAGMSKWTFLLYLLPVINVFAYITWCSRICRVRQKHPILAFFLILPVTNVPAFLYLALSGTPGIGDDHHTADGRVKLGYRPA